MSFFSAEHISAGYGEREVVRDLSFHAPAGTLTGILGANGCGKTTLLKTICGILPHKGSCALDGISLESLSPRQLARLCSYIPQRSGITIDISALEVVLMGFNPHLKLLEHPNRAMREKALQALSAVGLAGKEETNYLQLSEGQKQLCILARTLVGDSRLLLLDEPESALDFRFRHDSLILLSRWVRERESCSLITLHDPALALNYCHQLLLMDNGQLLATLYPQTDPPAHMEQLLRQIYGNISLHRCCDRGGRPQLVMFREDPL